MKRQRRYVMIGTIGLLIGLAAFTYKPSTELGRITCRTIGCFGTFSENLRIYRKDDRLYSKLQMNDTIMETQIDSTQLAAFTASVRELKALTPGGYCTSQRLYTIEMDREVFVRKDNGCQWNGLEALLETLYRLPNHVNVPD